MGEVLAFPSGEVLKESQAPAAMKILAWWRQLSPEDKQAFREWMKFYS